MKTPFQFRVLAVVASLVPLFSGVSQAGLPSFQPSASSRSLVISNISYVNWTAATIAPRGRATGLIISNLHPIALTYEGEVAPATQIDGGINYWLPRTPYLSQTISNLPPTADIIALSEESTLLNTLLFSEPVEDPVLLILSLGRAGIGVTYDFDAPFELLSQGPGYWGDGQLFRSEPDMLLGFEGHGAIQFRGTFSSLSWRVFGTENWHGFTVGIPVDVASTAVIPEGKAWMASAVLVAAIGIGTRRRFSRRH